MIQQKTLFAGPWIGEFGWELFCWHGFLRKIACKYERVIVACRTGHDLLYRDFATDIINYDTAHLETDMWKNHGETNPRFFHRYYTEGLTKLKIIPHDAFQERWWFDEPWSKRQEFISFGQYSGTKSYDILMVVRHTEKCNTGYRNWPINEAAKFATTMHERGYRLACVGTRKQAVHIPHTDDILDLPLHALAQVMADARVIVGPQSGPVHFGSLCLLPQVCWQTCNEHAVRTAIHWNPFNVPVVTLPGSDIHWKKRVMWQPMLGDIVNATERVLKGTVR